jgi:hypothetical protein
MVLAVSQVRLKVAMGCTALARNSAYFSKKSLFLGLFVYHCEIDLEENFLICTTA